MPCKCLGEIQEKLEAKHDAPVELETLDVVVLSEKGNEPLRYAGTMPYSYQPKRKNGQPGKLKQRSRVYFTFCPFCGTPYRKEADTAPSTPEGD